METLKDDLTPEERKEFVELLKPIAEGHADDRIRIDAEAAREQLSGTGPKEK